MRKLTINLVNSPPVFAGGTTYSKEDKSHLISPNYMKTLYLDAAGDPGWPPPFGKSRVEWYVLAGLALGPDDDLRIAQEIQKLLKEYVADAERAKWPSRNYEIHYHDIIFGKNIFSSLDDIKRKELSDKIFSLFALVKPTIFATAVNKTQMKRVYGGNAWNPRLLSMQSTIRRFSMYLRRENQVGTAMVDEEEYKKDKQIRQLVHNLKRYGAGIPNHTYQPMDDRLERLLNAISMSPSEMSTGTQLADVCSRSIWSHFEKSKSNRYLQLQQFFDSYNGVVYEPSIVPARHRWQ